jgi:hypothetical protein
LRSNELIVLFLIGLKFENDAPRSYLGQIKDMSLRKYDFNSSHFSTNQKRVTCNLIWPIRFRLFSSAVGRFRPCYFLPRMIVAHIWTIFGPIKFLNGIKNAYDSYDMSHYDVISFSFKLYYPFYYTSIRPVLYTTRKRASPSDNLFILHH